jgi:hypothetical protein
MASRYSRRHGACRFAGAPGLEPGGASENGGVPGGGVESPDADMAKASGEALAAAEATDAWIEEDPS